MRPWEKERVHALAHILIDIIRHTQDAGAGGRDGGRCGVRRHECAREGRRGSDGSTSMRGRSERWREGGAGAGAGRKGGRRMEEDGGASDPRMKRRLSVRVSFRFHPLETPPEQFRGDETRFFSILLNLLPCH